jgi:hypothetical protein
MRVFLSATTETLKQIWNNLSLQEKASVVVYFKDDLKSDVGETVLDYLRDRLAYCSNIVCVVDTDYFSRAYTLFEFDTAELLYADKTTIINMGLNRDFPWAKTVINLTKLSDVAVTIREEFFR